MQNYKLDAELYNKRIQNRSHFFSSATHHFY